MKVLGYLEYSFLLQLLERYFIQLKIENRFDDSKLILDVFEMIFLEREGNSERS